MIMRRTAARMGRCAGIIRRLCGGRLLA
ncbi:unnamed protein product [Linum tenue]|uniref:Uncharacterized protein n=1 Tax=Linum tenue TaxID=586396 RepID=A0AAV0I9H1_9ROSI|nr:unnamed protein product [Linum tenue]